MPNATNAALARVTTGIEGLDEVLAGGLLGGRVYLVSGAPGTGKTTIGWHFLSAGRAAGEAVMYVTFGEPPEQLAANARLSGFDTEGVHFVDLSPSRDDFARESYDIFSAAEVEREPTMSRILAEIDRVRPARVFVDSMTHLRYLASDAFAFRKQALSFLRFLCDGGAVVMVTSESSTELPDDDLRFLCDGVIELELGTHGRSLTVTKFRGSGFRGGRHTMRLGKDGATVFPRLVPGTFRAAFVPGVLSTGLPGLDRMLGGGIERGTVTLVTGPSGVGKTTLAMQLAKETASRGERTAIYTFDERAATLVARSEAMNVPVRAMLDRRTLAVVEIEALQYTPDEFANEVRRDVEQHDTRVIIIDSISGYRLCVAGDDITSRLHALSRYAQNVGVTVLLVNEAQDIAQFHISDVGITYLADNVIFLRYVESFSDDRAELRKGVGVLKKRLGDFDKSLRALDLSHNGLEVGESFANVTGIVGTLPRIDDRAP